MANEFLQIGQDLGGLIFRKRNQRWKDEQDEKDLKRKAFLQTLMEDAAMQRAIEANKGAMERSKLQEDRQDYRSLRQAGVMSDNAMINEEGADRRHGSDLKARKEQAAIDWLNDQYDLAQKRKMDQDRMDREFGTRDAANLIRERSARANELKAVGYLTEQGMGVEDDELQKLGIKRQNSGIAEEPKSTGWFGGGKPTNVRPKFKLNGETIQTSPAAPNLPAPSAPMPPTESGSRKSSMVTPDGMGVMGGRDLVEDLLSRLTGRTNKPAIKQ